MNCPACDVECKIMPDRTKAEWPTEETFTTIFPNTSTTHKVFKCCEETCWVTRIEVEWGNHD